MFWQWVNQSFNALVNFTNRNAKSPISTTQLGVAYFTATASAMVTAVGCKSYWQKNAGPFIQVSIFLIILLSNYYHFDINFQRYVPFAAVAAANCANIPLMRQTELIQGIDVSDLNGNLVGQSRLAAVKGISQVVISRIIMCAPGMLVLPVIMERLEKYPWMQKIKPLHAPIQVMGVGCL